jgi:hypothetical protein
MHEPAVVANLLFLREVIFGEEPMYTSVMREMRKKEAEAITGKNDESSKVDEKNKTLQPTDGGSDDSSQAAEDRSTDREMRGEDGNGSDPTSTVGNKSQNANDGDEAEMGDRRDSGYHSEDGVTSDVSCESKSDSGDDYIIFEDNSPDEKQKPDSTCEDEYVDTDEEYSIVDITDEEDGITVIIDENSLEDDTCAMDRESAV